MRGTLAVRARGITKAFGEVVALDGVDLEVEEGQVHGLVGPNGAGKTTLLGLLLGLAEADDGELEILRQSASDACAARRGRGLCRWTGTVSVAYSSAESDCAGALAG
jgi:ABC-2 type transport system ATP-binding protein